MKWYKHFTGMRLDTKMKRLIKKYGITGYGLYNYILESIAFNLSPEKPTPTIEDNYVDIAADVGMESTKAEEIILFCVEQGLFEINEETNQLYCMKLLNHLDNTLSSNPEIKKILNNFKFLKETSSNLKQIRLDKIRLDNNNILSSTEVDDSAFFDNSNNNQKQPKTIAPTKKKETAKLYFQKYKWNDCIKEFDNITDQTWNFKTIWTQKELANLKRLLSILEKIDVEKNESCYQLLDSLLDSFTVHYRFTRFNIGTAKANPTPSNLLQHINDVKFLDEQWYNAEFDKVRKKADSIDI
jgi:hypothetical protein